MTTVVVMAAGLGNRWGDHTGVPKHLVVVEGERLLDRTVRLAFEYGVDRVVVVGPDDDRYRVPGAELHTPPALGDDTTHRGVTKFVNTVPLWPADDRVVLAYGDVWFSDAAVARIVGDRRREWLHWCRFSASQLTGCRWGECFAQSFWPEHHASYVDALHRVAAAHAAGVIGRSGGWEVARAMCGATGRGLAAHRRYAAYQEIDDWTEDMDYPDDLSGWLARRPA